MYLTSSGKLVNKTGQDTFFQNLLTIFSYFLALLAS